MENIDTKAAKRTAGKPPRIPLPPIPRHQPAQRTITMPVNVPPPPPVYAANPLVPPPPGSGLYQSSLAVERVVTLIPEVLPLSASEIISRELSIHAVPFNSEILRLIRSEIPASTVQRLMKRLLDLVGATVAIVLLSPVIAAVALAVKFSSKGPVLFSQTRVGKNGRLFKFYKFRSMVTNAETLKKDLMAKNECEGPAFKMKNDPRVTSVGRFLRKSSLDELPQLYNVLRGDMSLVGPRPAIPAEVEQWKPWQHKRLAVEQGCTCIWQVSGRSDVNFDQWMRMDLKYVQTWSLALDISIIFRTILVMLTGKGAY